VSIYDWSPDDSKILYGPSYYTPGYEPDVWTMNPDGSSRTPILTLSSVDMPGIYGLRYAPNGKKLVFAGAVHGEKESQSYYNLYLVDIDGTNLTKLIGNDVNWQPSWSADGQKIVFVRLNSSNGESDIWTINVDGAGLRQLTNLPGSELHPSWSPDGKRIAFIHDTKDGPTNSTVNIVNPDGTGQTTLLNSTFNFQGQLSWSPDSSIIIASGVDDMYAFSIDGRVVRRIVASGWNPHLSHDGRRIFYEGAQPQTMRPVVLNLGLATFNKPKS
jgi:Tol biopolymer transport system component